MRKTKRERERERGGAFYTILAEDAVLLIFLVSRCVINVHSGDKHPFPRYIIFFKAREILISPSGRVMIAAPRIRLHDDDHRERLSSLPPCFLCSAALGRSAGGIGEIDRFVG
jgi:hypothetical protein